MDELALRLGCEVEVVRSRALELERLNLSLIGPKAPMSRIPSRLLHDVSEGGGLETVLRSCIEGEPLDVIRVKEALRSVLLERYRIAWSDDLPDAIRSELAEIAEAHGAQIVTQNPTHVVCAGESDKVGSRIMAVKGDQALVHRYYSPESYDTWVDLKEARSFAAGALTSPHEETRAKGKHAWRVSARFVRDVANFNEWGNESDYEISNSKRKFAEMAGGRDQNDRSIGQVAVLPPSADGGSQSLRAKRDVVIATVDSAGDSLSLATATAPKTSEAQQASHVVGEDKKAATQPPTLKRNVFDASGVTPLERACCPEWFCGDTIKTPEKYIEARNWMISQSNSRPQNLLTATFCRQRLGVDACAAIRLFHFVDAWGLVNSQVPPTARRVAKPRPKPPPFFNEDRDKTKRLSPGEIRALVDAVKRHQDDWTAVATAVNSIDGGSFGASDCASCFVELPLGDPLRGHSASTRSADANATKQESVVANISPPSAAVLAREDESALDALIETRLAKVEQRLQDLAKAEAALDIEYVVAVCHVHLLTSFLAGAARARRNEPVSAQSGPTSPPTSIKDYESVKKNPPVSANQKWMMVLKGSLRCVPCKTATKRQWCGTRCPKSLNRCS